MSTQGDIRLVYEAEQGFADLVVDDRDLARDDGLETAVTISLFTNRRADAEDLLPDDDGSLQGWWADNADPADNDPDYIGSKLWLLGRGKFTIDLPARAEEFAGEALQWMIDDGVASAVQVQASRTVNNELLIEVRIVRPDGVTATFFRYFYNWQNQIARSG
jgi:phage gp46-like protein